MLEWRDIGSQHAEAVDLDRPSRRGAASANRAQGAAERILHAVIPDTLTSNEPTRPAPLPVAQLLSTRHRNSITFAIPRIDRSGRAHDRLVNEAAGWQPGERVEIIATTHAVLFRPHPSGLMTVSKSRCITLPAPARHRFNLRAGDRILLAAIDTHRVVVAYPLATLDTALAALHEQLPR